MCMWWTNERRTWWIYDNEDEDEDEVRSLRKCVVCHEYYVNITRINTVPNVPVGARGYIGFSSTLSPSFRILYVIPCPINCHLSYAFNL
jgi:hypothetical protein